MEERDRRGAWARGGGAPRPDRSFRTALTVGGFLHETLFRTVQDDFVRAHGAAVTGAVIEIGGEPEEGDHRAMFPQASDYLVTNVGEGAEHVLDVTAIELPDGSHDVFLCVSVMEHVDDIQRGFAELARTLRPGGLLILTMPFLYPMHDTRDVWRVAADGFADLLGPDMEVVAFEHLGGRVSTLASLLQRPTGDWHRRFVPFKLLGLVLVALLGRFDRLDDSALGFGVVARRRDAGALGTVASSPE